MNDINRAAAILAGCPDGATEAALALNNVTRETMDALVEAGEARFIDLKHSNPAGLVVRKYWSLARSLKLIEA